MLTSGLPRGSGEVRSAKESRRATRYGPRATPHSECRRRARTRSCFPFRVGRRLENQFAIEASRRRPFRARSGPRSDTAIQILALTRAYYRLHLTRVVIQPIEASTLSASKRRAGLCQRGCANSPTKSSHEASQAKIRH
jgi:hypothetical protein